MTCHRAVGILCVVLLALSAAHDATAQAKAATEDAAAAVKASTDLVKALSTEIGSTPQQAAGAAGALFSMAKSRLNTDQFTQVSKAVPGMSALLKAAPAMGGGGGALGALSQVAGTTGSAGGL